jgi:tetratricopeptide (TPR) repeat protein
MALASHAGIRSPKQIEVFDRLDQEDANIRRALNHLLERGEANAVSRAGWVLWYFWWGRGRLVEGMNLMSRVCQSGSCSGRDLGRARAIDGALAMFVGDFGRAVTCLTTALDEMRKIDDLEGIGYAQTALGLVAGVIEGPEQMLKRMNEAIACFRKIDDEWARILPLTATGWMAVGMDLKNVPDDILEEAVEIGNRLGGPLERYMAIGTYGWRLLHRDRCRAADLIKQSIVAFAEGEVRYGVAHQMGAVAELAQLEGDPALAVRLYAEAAAIREEIGAPLLPAFESRRAQKLEELKMRLGEETYKREHDVGLTYSYERAVQEALELCERVLASTVSGGSS